MKSWIAIFGSRVLADGSPSGSLLRRTLEGYRLSCDLDVPHFFVSGGTTDSSVPTEASVMHRILTEQGVSHASIHCDHDSRDTLASVYALAANTNAQDRIYVCSDNYHVLRITWLLVLLGHRATPLWIASGRAKTGTANWLFMWFREAVATLYDSVLVVWFRLFGGAIK